MSLNRLLATCLCAGALLLGASAQVTTADIYLPIADDTKSLTSEFQASIVSSGQTTVFALSCTGGPCNLIAGETETMTFTAAPDTFIYTASRQGGMDYNLQCALKGCPSISDVECVATRVLDGETAVSTGHPTFTDRIPVSLDEEVPEVTAIECPTTAPPKETGSDDEGEEDGDGSDEEDGGSEDGGDDGGEGSALANVPFFGLVAGAAAGVAGVLL